MQEIPQCQMKWIAGPKRQEEGKLLTKQVTLAAKIASS